MSRSRCLLLAGALALSSAMAAEPEPTYRGSYPTSVLADYVLGCMMSNGQSPEILGRCACSMDMIADAIPYDEYEKTETLLRLQQIPGGGRTAIYKESSWAKNAITRLREVQAESTLRCF